MVRKIISGGQTGADQAALDFAIEHKIPHGGWLPKGRLTEEGPLDEKYKLQEMETDSYPKRTEKNVLDSDGTVLISYGKLSGGTEVCERAAVKHNKPYLHIDMDTKSLIYSGRLLKSWIIANGVCVLNVAGARASEDKKIYKAVSDVLKRALIV